jgi:hypothetical protein
MDLARSLPNSDTDLAFGVAPPGTSRSLMFLSPAREVLIQ